MEFGKVLKYSVYVFCIITVLAILKTMVEVNTGKTSIQKKEKVTVINVSMVRAGTALSPEIIILNDGTLLENYSGFGVIQKGGSYEVLLRGKRIMEIQKVVLKQ